jgi:hypothetical protein
LYEEVKVKECFNIIAGLEGSLWYMGVFPMIQQTVTILPFSVSSTAFMEDPMVVV